MNRKSNCFLDLFILRKVLNSLMVAFFVSWLPLTPYAREAKRLLGVDLDLGSISAAPSNNQVFSVAKIWLLAGD